MQDEGTRDEGMRDAGRPGANWGPHVLAATMPPRPQRTSEREIEARNQRASGEGEGRALLLLSCVGPRTETSQRARATEGGRRAGARLGLECPRLRHFASACV